jgi:hypothetical protein
MKQKVYLLPLTLLVLLGVVVWSCEDKKDEDVCEKFQPQAQCEIANACCPQDGGNCYYELGDRKFYCDKTKATSTDKDGCNEAEDQVLTAACPASKSFDFAAAKVELRALTQRLLQEARSLSVCN